MEATFQVTLTNIDREISKWVVAVFKLQYWVWQVCWWCGNYSTARHNISSQTMINLRSFHLWKTVSLKRREERK